MRTIYKYDITDGSNGIVEGPITKILCADVQYGNIKIWAEIDTEAPIRKFEIFPIGTGWVLDPPLGRECVLDSHTYLNTVQLINGSLIFHIYYKDITPSTVKQTSSTPVTTNKKHAVKSESMINPDVLRKFIQ